MPDKELDAMQTINTALAELGDEDAVKRVLQWAASKHGVAVTVGKSLQVGSGDGGGIEMSSQFGNIADLFDAASPSTEPEKVVVVAYWFQEVQGQADLDSQSLNTELKNLGHGVGNITRALDNLIGRKPRLVIQTRKSGTSQQARKRYKLTVEGIRFAKAMIEANKGE